MPDIPFDYAVDQLAQRWHVPPWELLDQDASWLSQGLTFVEFEARARPHTDSDRK